MLKTSWPSTRTHPLGQTLIVTAGCGRVRRWGGPIEEIRRGDVVWIAPGVKHWHGATPTTAMTHIAIQEQLNGKVVDWMEKVSEEQYRARGSIPGRPGTNDRSVSGQTYGRLDVMINNAGLMPQSPLERLKIDEWNRMIDVNIKGMLYCRRASLHEAAEGRAYHQWT
jgi:hypothetical protein